MRYLRPQAPIAGPFLAACIRSLPLRSGLEVEEAKGPLLRPITMVAEAEAEAVV